MVCALIMDVQMDATGVVIVLLSWDIDSIYGYEPFFEEVAGLFSGRNHHFS